MRGALYGCLNPLSLPAVSLKHIQWQPTKMGKMDGVILPASDCDINASVRVNISGWRGAEPTRGPRFGLFCGDPKRPAGGQTMSDDTSASQRSSVLRRHAAQIWRHELWDPERRVRRFKAQGAAVRISSNGTLT